MLKNLVNVYSISFLAIAITGWLAHEPTASPLQKAELVKPFKLERKILSFYDRKWTNERRLFAPPFQHLEGWLKSFVSSGVAVADLDGDGVDNDACFTDAFENKVTVSQGLTKESPKGNFFALNPEPLPNNGKTFPSGCLFGDFNEDGRNDILIYFWGRAPLVFLQTSSANSKHLSTIDFKALEIVPTHERWHTESIAVGDVDGDGKLDLVAANYFPENSNVLEEIPDGISEMNEGAGNALNGAYNRLLLGRPSLERLFTEAKGAFGDNEGGAQWTIATAAVDLDGDQLPEILFINDHGPDRLLHNRSTPGNPKFQLVKGVRKLTTSKSMTLGLDSFHGMGIDFADWNKDGNLDFLISNFNASYLFYQANFAWINTGEKEEFQKGKAPFESQAETMGFSRTAQVPWDVRFVDLNNDGNLEIFQATGFMRGKTPRKPEVLEFALWNDAIMKFPIGWHRFNYDDEISGKGPNALFAANSNGRYTDIGGELGLHEPGVSRGVSTTDLDGDGRMDLAVAHQNADPTLFFNESQKGPFLGLVLTVPYNASSDEIIADEGLPPTKGSSLSRRAIGANVKFDLPNGQKVTANVDGGSGFSGKKAPVIHIGLGSYKVEGPIPAQIDWRDSQGKLHSKKINLTPGWHKLQLGRPTVLAER